MVTFGNVCLLQRLIYIMVKYLISILINELFFSRLKKMVLPLVYG